MPSIPMTITPLTLLSLCSVALALPAPMSPEAMSEASSLVVEGEITEVVCQGEPMVEETYTTTPYLAILTINEVLKGEALETVSLPFATTEWSPDAPPASCAGGPSYAVGNIGRFYLLEDAATGQATLVNWNGFEAAAESTSAPLPTCQAPDDADTWGADTTEDVETSEDTEEIGPDAVDIEELVDVEPSEDTEEKGPDAVDTEGPADDAGEAPHPGEMDGWGWGEPDGGFFCGTPDTAMAYESAEPAPEPDALDPSACEAGGDDAAGCGDLGTGEETSGEENSGEEDSGEEDSGEEDSGGGASGGCAGGGSQAPLGLSLVFLLMLTGANRMRVPHWKAISASLLALALSGCGAAAAPRDTAAAESEGAHDASIGASRSHFGQGVDAPVPGSG
ncbi:MAG: hypothetical protein ACPGU1_23230 [Myxococcota bacterium]